MVVPDLLRKGELREFLRRTGLEAPVRQVLRILRNPRNLRFDLDVAADYRAFKRRYGPIFARGSEFADPNRKVLFLSFADYPNQIRAEAFLAKALQLRGVTPVMVTTSWLTQAQRYYRVFGIHDYAFFDQIPDKLSPEGREAIDQFFSQPFSVRDLKVFRYKGTRVGSHTLRTITRTTFRGSIDLSNQQTRHTLREVMQWSVHSVDRAEALLDALQPVAVFTHHPLNIEEGDIFEVALVRGIDTIYWDTAQKARHWLFKRYSQRNQTLHYNSVDDETWERIRHLAWTPEQEAALMAEIRQRYDPDSHADKRRLQQGKQFKDREAIQRELGLDPGKKTAVIFSHITWDASFLYGDDLFDHYEDWLIQAMRAACTNPDLNWIVKLHPANLVKHKVNRVKGEYSEIIAIREAIGDLPEHVKLLYPETDINTWSLFDLTDYCLTVRGTIGIEMPVFGIPVLTAGTGRYSGRGFTIDSATPEEYLGRLACLHEVGRLAPEQIELAKKHAYWLLLKRPVEFPLWEAVRHRSRSELKSRSLPEEHEFQIHSLDDLIRDEGLERFARWVLSEASPDFYL